MIKITNNTIEQFSVGAVSALTEGSNYLALNSPPFSGEPSFDGTLLYYPNTNNTKKGLLKIDIQVKGTTIDKNNSFAFEVTDLENYQRNNGVLLFVVKITKSMDGNPKKRVLTKLLMPNKIKRLLKGKGHQKTLTIKLKQIFITEDLLRLCREYEIYRNDINDGRSMLGPTFIPLVENVKSIKTIYDGIPISPDDTPMYITIETNQGRYYHEDAILELAKMNVKEDVMVNGYLFYNQFEVHKKKDIVITKLSDSIEIIQKTNEYVIIVNEKSPFSDYAHALRFLVEVRTDDTISLGNRKLVLEGLSKKIALHDNYFIRLNLICTYMKENNFDMSRSFSSYTEQQQRLYTESSMYYTAEKLKIGLNIIDIPITSKDKYRDT